MALLYITLTGMTALALSSIVMPKETKSMQQRDYNRYNYTHDTFNQMHTATMLLEKPALCCSIPNFP